jgi:hypothetical protein
MAPEHHDVSSADFWIGKSWAARKLSGWWAKSTSLTACRSQEFVNSLPGQWEKELGIYLEGSGGLTISRLSVSWLPYNVLPGHEALARRLWEGPAMSGPGNGISCHGVSIVVDASSVAGTWHVPRSMNPKKPKKSQDEGRSLRDRREIPGGELALSGSRGEGLSSRPDERRESGREGREKGGRPGLVRSADVIILPAFCRQEGMELRAEDAGREQRNLVSYGDEVLVDAILKWVEWRFDCLAYTAKLQPMLLLRCLHLWAESEARLAPQGTKKRRCVMTHLAPRLSRANQGLARIDVAVDLLSWLVACRQQSAAASDAPEQHVLGHDGFEQNDSERGWAGCARRRGRGEEGSELRGGRSRWNRMRVSTQRVQTRRMRWQVSSCGT